MGRLKTTVTSLLGLGTLLVACNAHPIVPAFRSIATLPDRGIAIPIPPPSVVTIPEEPVEAEVYGTVEGMDGLDAGVEAGTEVRVVDLVGGAEASTILDEDGQSTFKIAGVSIVLEDHCLELWLETPDGRPSDVSQYHAEVEVDDAGAPILDADGRLTLTTYEGCAELSALGGAGRLSE